MKFHNNSNVLLVTSVITVLAVGIYTTANYLFPTTDDGSSALTYGSNTDISFTFDPKLSIATSTDSLTIDNLVPGTTSDSNTVSVTVSSNTQYGYVLSAGVGSTVSTDPYYNTSDLVHDNSTTQVPTTNKFSSIATSASLPTLDTDNTWGYSTSTDGGTSWSTYSGLSHAETKPLLDISDPATPSTIDFKIAARSANTQASGTYNNVITFYAVGKPKPLVIEDLENMQEFGAITESDLESVKTSMAEEVNYAIKDERDERSYTIAKLKDGKIWMTQNLELAGGTSLYSETSDVPSGYSLLENKPYYTLPNSSESGFNSDFYPFVYNTPYSDEDRTTCAADHPCYSYYSWLAATVSSGSWFTKDNKDAPYSICPKGWKLPNTRSYATEESDFYKFAVAYGMDQGGIEAYMPSFINEIGQGTIPNFTRAGAFLDGFKWGGEGMEYWSSTSTGSSGYNNTTARSFLVSSPFVYTAIGNNRRAGLPVRCIAR